MPLLVEDLIADLKLLPPHLLRDAAAYVKRLCQGEIPPPSPDLSFRVTPSDDVIVEECGQAALAALGADPLGQSFLVLVDPEFRAAAEQAFASVRRRTEIRNVRLRLMRAGGDSFPVIFAARCLVAAAGKDALIDVVCRDISSLKRLSNIEIFCEMLSIGVALVDEQGLITFANSCAERMFGFEHGELALKPIEFLLPLTPLPIGPFPAADNVANHRQVEANQEVRGRRKDASEIALKIGWSSIRLGDHRFVVASIADITAVKSIEKTLRKHEDERALIFREGLLGDFTWNIDRDEVEAHPTVFKLYGAAPIAGPVPSAWFRSRQHPDDRAAIAEKWFSQMEAGGQLGIEFRIIGDDGALRWIDCRGVVIRDQSGSPLLVHGLNIDITARKQAEARARSAEDRLKVAVQFSCVTVWRWHIDDDLAEWFGPVFELTGKRADELPTFSAFTRILFPADVAPLEEALARCMSSGSEYRHEFRIVRPDGQIRWLAGRGGLLRDANGAVYGVTGVNFDITDRKNAEEELRQSEQNFRQLTNFLPQIVFTASAKGVVDFHNERFYELLGSTSELLPADQIWTAALKEEDREPTLRAWLECINAGQLFQRECRLWDRCRQEYRWYLARALPARNAEGAIVRWIGTTTDIHEHKTASEQLESQVLSRTVDLNRSLHLLRQREEQLEKSLHEKDAMLREIHHRVKNNLQIVSSLLSMQATNAADTSALGALRDSERRIASMAMIHEQLYGTDDMQTLEFAEHARSLSQILEASMAENSLVSCKLHLEPVSLTINQAIPCALILNELLTNAFKYAYPSGTCGEITVNLSLDQGWVHLTVADQGVGLPSSVNPFSPKTLGLEIIQVLVDQLEGQLIVAACPGASFTLKFRHHTYAVARAAAKND